jgi:hypothetical protein
METEFHLRNILTFIKSLIPSGLAGDFATFCCANNLFMPARRGLAVDTLLDRGDTAISPGPLGVSGRSENREWGVPVLIGVLAGDLDLGVAALGVLNISFTPDGLTALFFTDYQ